MREREGYKPEQIRNKAFAYVDLSKRQKEVYNIIQKWQPISNESIASHLNLHPHQVTPRVLELRQMGYVTFAGEGKTADGRPFSFWKINPNGKQLTLF